LESSVFPQARDGKNEKEEALIPSKNYSFADIAKSINCSFSFPTDD